MRRRRPSATAGETCSSRRNLSTLASYRFPGGELERLRQHAFECLEISGVVLRDSYVDFFRERRGIVNGCPHLYLWPSEMLSDRRHIFVITTDEQHYLPHCKR